MILSDETIGTIDVAAHYDSLDRFYREIWGEHVHHGFWEKGDETAEEATLHLSHFLAKWIGVSPGDQICDVGCGYGGTSRLLADEYQAEVTGFTLSEQQAEYALKKTTRSGRVTIHCQDFMANDLSSNSFDGLISIECLEHMIDKQAAFAEAYRVLKPGRRMAVALWAATDKPSPMQTRLLEAICREGRLPGLPTGEEYCDLMAHAGFHVTKEREISDQVKKTWMICAQRLARRIVTDSSYRSFLWNSPSKDKIFAFTLVRIMAAFQMRAMKYWVFAAEKPLVVN